jgi:hypothetical protein
MEEKETKRNKNKYLLSYSYLALGNDSLLVSIKMKLVEYIFPGKGGMVLTIWPSSLILLFSLAIIN